MKVIEQNISFNLSIHVPLEFSPEIEKNLAIDTTQNANGDSQTSTDRSDPNFEGKGYFWSFRPICNRTYSRKV